MLDTSQTQVTSSDSSEGKNFSDIRRSGAKVRRRRRNKYLYDILLEDDDDTENPQRNPCRTLLEFLFLACVIAPIVNYNADISAWTLVMVPALFVIAYKLFHYMTRLM